MEKISEGDGNIHILFSLFEKSIHWRILILKSEKGEYAYYGILESLFWW